MVSLCTKFLIIRLLQCWKCASSTSGLPTLWLQRRSLSWTGSRSCSIYHKLGHLDNHCDWCPVDWVLVHRLHHPKKEQADGEEGNVRLWRKGDKDPEAINPWRQVKISLFAKTKTQKRSTLGDSQKSVCLPGLITSLVPASVCTLWTALKMLRKRGCEIT